MTDREFQILEDEEGAQIALLLLDKTFGVFYRDSGEWVPMDDPDDLPFELEQLTARDANASDVAWWDQR